ncbi:MAG: hypothetical protein LBI49_21805 [Nocardiopsaceae bacterium]|nr:hypothetical protein [Nocardiopsaceae bacterium]
MLSWPGRRERPDRPLTGFKLAHAVLAADGRRAGFAGLTIGAHRVYGVTADASCAWRRRHAPPVRWCGCGFYCLHTRAEATALGCATEHRAAVLLEITASGRYLRYDRGLRYSRQRVRAVRAGRCGCGQPAAGLADSGRGFPGWRCLTAACPACLAGRPFLSFADFASRLDRPVPVTAGEWGWPAGPARAASASGVLPGPPGGSGPGPAPGKPRAPGEWLARGEGPARGEAPDPAAMATLAAEVALVHARLDDLQARLSRLDGGGSP